MGESVPANRRRGAKAPSTKLPPLQPVPAARPVAGYVGGKKQLATELARRIEATPHTLYGEVFAGMAGVFFKRQLAPKAEALNDINRDVAGLFRILQHHYQPLMDFLRWQVASREEFSRLMEMNPDQLTDIQRAARFLFLQRMAFGGKVVGRSYGIDTRGPAGFDVGKLGVLLAAAHERLRGVYIECLPWDAFLDRWDRPGALFYLDPPYWGSEHYYGRTLFPRSEFERLATRLKTLKGRFILSVNDVPQLREMLSGFKIETARVTYTTGSNQQKHKNGELIVSG
jgi:DNA adenine methylase